MQRRSSRPGRFAAHRYSGTRTTQDELLGSTKKHYQNLSFSARSALKLRF